MFFQDLETERLHIANIGRADRAFLRKEFSTDAVNRFLFDAEPMRSLEEADAVIDFYLQPEPREQHRWVLRLRDGMEPIGTCGFHCWDRERGSVELGYDMQEPYWGRGLMTEALRAVLAVYVPKMEVAEVHAHIYPENGRSIALAERLGFRFEGRTTTYAFRGNDYLHRVYTLRPAGAKQQGKQNG